MEVIFKWRGKEYTVHEDEYELPPKSSKDEIKRSLEDSISLGFYNNVDYLVQQGLKYGYLEEIIKTKTKKEEPKQKHGFW